MLHTLSADQMDVDMEDRLPGIGAGVGDDAETGLIDAFAFCQLTGNSNKMSHELFIIYFQCADG